MAAMSLESVTLTYGYWAIFVGTAFEGETILIIGGFLAHRGYLDLREVITAAFLGSLLGDQVYFLLGRVRGRPFLGKRPRWRCRMSKAQDLLERYQSWVIVGFRFLYGLRTVTPFALGMGNVSALRFLLLNTIGALAWALVVGGAGYLFGTTMEALLGSIKHLELELVAGIAAAGGLLWMAHFYRVKRVKRKGVSARDGNRETKS